MLCNIIGLWKGYSQGFESVLRDRCGVTTGCATEMGVDTTIRAVVSREYQVGVASDGHTTRDQPHLDAATIMQHPNDVWEHLILPDREIKVASSEAFLDPLHVTTLDAKCWHSR